MVTLAESLFGQALALGKTPLDLLRGSGGEEKVLKNAKDACATEALEIATYTAIERLARAVGDDETADLAASIRADEQRMLERILREIPRLTGAVVGGRGRRRRLLRHRQHGAAEAVKRTATQARRVPGVARAEGEVKGALASEEDLAIAGYDRLTVGRDHRAARRPLADRPGQGRRLRAQEPGPDAASPSGSRSCAATSRGRATTS